jgi:4-diphosphocytidyl-2-C-methyl-D-erythritol kinase
MKALAKVNLFLHVIEGRPDGYHRLNSLVVFLKDLYDLIDIQESDHTEVLFTGPWSKNIPNENTVTRALTLMQQYLPQHFKVVVKKNIPAGSGLGGGSSDAACVVQHLSKKYALELSHDKLVKLCLSIGADVPMFMYSKALYMSELGEVIDPLTKDLPSIALLAACPNHTVSTALVYHMGPAITPAITSWPKAFDNLLQLVELLKLTRNDLYKNSLQLLPELATLLTELEHLPGCLLARMTGSGSACIGLFDSVKGASAALSALQKKFPLYSIYVSTAQ